MCSHSVSQIYFYIERKSVGIVGLEGRNKIAANESVFEMAGYSVFRHTEVDFYFIVEDKNCL
jgi:hypothetical protein